MPLGSTSARAAEKSSHVTCMDSRISDGIALSRSMLSMRELRQCMAASLHRAARSAPTKPWVTDASLSGVTSPAIGMSLMWTDRIWALPAALGMPISISLSNLPGRLRAGSMESSLFVAPMTMTFPRFPRPSMRVSSWATTLLSTSPEASSLLGAIESISSRKTMLGAFFSASLKISLSRSSLCP